MSLNLEGLELTAEQLTQINSQNKGLVSELEIEGLKKNRDDLLAEKKTAQEATALAEKQVEDAKIESLKNKNDHEALALSYKEKLDGYELRDQENALKLQQQTVSNKALEMAKSISSGDNADLLATFIEKRLRSDNGEIKVTDVDGNLTISTQEELLSEFKANQRYASLVVATNASGGSTTVTTKHDGGAVVDKTDLEAAKVTRISERLAAKGIQLKQ